MNAPILDVVDFSGGFTSPEGIRPVLHHVSFSLAPGATTAIVGETGSGKTLTALAVLGILPASFQRSGGAIIFQGTDLLALGRNALQALRGARISMVFQDARASLNPVFTVGNQIADVCRLHQKVSRQEALRRAEEMLDRVRVPQARRRMRQYPHEFSGGMAQRAQLAMALICRPSLLILDEPTTGLDVTIQADILELIADLTRTDGMTTMLITHDLGIVAELCDQVVVMRSGEVREAGSCQQIMTDPQSPYTRQLIADSRLERISA